MVTYNKIAVALVTSLSLAACGGGSSGSSSSSGNVSSDNYVAGTFSHIDSSPELYVPDSHSSFRLSYNCDVDDSGRFFESSKVVVAGGSSLSDDDFQYAATIVQNNLTLALSKMGHTESDYAETKRKYTSNFYGSFFSSLNVSYQFFDEDYENLYPEMTSLLLSAFGSMENAKLFLHGNFNPDDIYSNWAAYFSAISDDEIMRINSAINEESGGAFGVSDYYDAFEKKMHKTLVCLESGRSEDNWGEGFSAGIKIAPKSVASRNDAVDVIVHELIHHVQTVFYNQFNEIMPADRWFREGQAVYLSGMSITKGNHSRNPTVVVDFRSEDTHYSDLGLAYEDYGQAYKYLEDTYGAETLKTLLSSILEDRVNAKLELGGVSDIYYPAFDANFTNLLTDIDQFRMDYPNLNK